MGDGLECELAASMGFFLVLIEDISDTLMTSQPSFPTLFLMARHIAQRWILETS